VLAQAARAQGMVYTEATVDEIGALGRRALAVKCDVTDRGQVDAAVARVVDELGSLDILVNNAGTSLAFRPIADESRQPLMETLEVNLWGPSCGQTWPGERGCASTEARSSTMHRPVGS